jgi:protein TonB
VGRAWSDGGRFRLEREHAGRRRLSFLGAAFAAHAIALAAIVLAWGTPPPRPPTPIGVLLVPPGALLPLSAPPRARTAPAAGPRRADAARASAAPRPRAPRAAASGLARHDLDALAAPIGGGARGSASAAGEGHGFTGAAGAEVGSRWEGGTGSGGAEEASRWLVIHQKEIIRRVQEEIDRSPYPAAAAARRWTGKVRVAFIIAADGTVEDARVVRSSGRDILDRAALAAVRSAGPFPAPGRPQAVEVPVSFVLQG